MNTELFIARRIQSDQLNRKKFSATITGIVTIGIAVSVAVMLAAVAIVTGFKTEIRNKVIGFNSHIQILNYDSNLSYETSPVPSEPPFMDEIKEMKGC